jgi:hypothetical protein
MPQSYLGYLRDRRISWKKRKRSHKAECIHSAYQLNCLDYFQPSGLSLFCYSVGDDGALFSSFEWISNAL